MGWFNATGATVTTLQEWEKEEEMAKGEKGVIEVFRSPVCAHTLGYLLLGHRRLEKELPEAVLTTTAGALRRATYKMPADLLLVAGVPSEIVDQIDEITLEYEKRLDV